MTELLLEWVLTSVFLILVVLALRAALGGRVSARLRYALWAVVLVRLLVPVQLFASPLAGTWVWTEKEIEHDVYKLGSSSTEEDAIGRLGSVDGPTAVLTTGPDYFHLPDAPTAPDAPEPPAAPDLTKAPVWLGWAWLAGAAAAALVLLVSNLRFYRELRRARIPLDEADLPLRAYEAVGLPSPCLFGVLRPAVYVTPEAAADPDMLRHVLAHEYTHYRHGDHLWSLLRCAALAVHWWNPLVWLAAVLSQRDGELACDEGALKRLGDGERAGYGNTLLALVTAKPRPGDLFRCATTMAGDKKSLRERIARIARAPRCWLWAAALAVLVTALACVCAFGQAEPKDGPDPEPSDPVEEFVLSYSMGEPRTVLVEGLGDAHVVWSRGTNGGALEFDGVGFCCPRLAGEKVEGGAFWDGASENVLSVGLNVKDDLGTDIRYTISFTVDMNSGAVLSRVFRSEIEGEDPLELTDQEMVGIARALARPLTEAWEYYQSHAEEPTAPVSGLQADLDRDGVPEMILTTELDEGGVGQRLEVWKGDKLIFEEEGYYAHAGYNALFLCTLDGEDYLLRYHPAMYQGHCSYEYQLFTLENGRETVARENHVDFDTYFHPIFQYDYGFDPEAIAAFMDEVNGLLAHSVQLLNTDYDLSGAFEREGRLHDSLWWLDTWEPVFIRDENASLAENLRAFKAAMEAQWYAEEPELTNLSETAENAHVWLRYKDQNAQFDVDCWDSAFQPAGQVDIQVFDLNGDGKDELVFPLVWGHGTGAYIEKLYVFDAETLEQYDTSRLNDMILSSVVSTGDGENFRLSGPGMDQAIPKSEAGKYNEYAPVADALALGEVVRYTVQDGRVFCRLGCDASGAAINYIGYVDALVRMDARGNFSCGGARYVAGDPF